MIGLIELSVPTILQSFPLFKDNRAIAANMSSLKPASESRASEVSTIDHSNHDELEEITDYEDQLQQRPRNVSYI